MAVSVCVRSLMTWRAAPKLGYQRIFGFDNDPEAIRVSLENAALNGLQGKVAFLAGDLVSGLKGRQADVLMANILANVLIEFAPQLVAAVAPGGVLILSGILAKENAEVRAAYAKAAPGWRMDFRELGEWSDVLPIDDLGIRKGAQVVDKLDAMLPPKALAERGERWGPYRTYASFYLWRIADFGGQTTAAKKAPTKRSQD